jgi:hypothetical protein
MAVSVREPARDMTGFAAAFGVILARGVVPLYFALGAVLKLVDASASHLPPALIKLAGWAGLDLMYLFHLSIGVELAVAGTMVVVARLARPLGLVLLGFFLPILVAGVAMGSASCGCFGAVAVPPAVTLVIDGLLFGLLWFFGAKAPSLAWRSEIRTAPVILAGLWVVASFILGFAAGGAWVAADEASEIASGPAGDVLPTEGFYLPDYASWIGRQWSDVKIAGWIQGDGSIVGSGVEYVTFYRKDCEHCHELMAVWFQPDVPAPTLAVAVPERDGFPTVGLQPFECDACSLAELPAGIDWFLATPVLVRLRDGVVECAAEVNAGEPECVEF